MNLPSFPMDVDLLTTPIPPNLNNVPSEVISLIAYHLALSSGAHHPPSALIPFFSTCSAIRSALTVDANPQFYAKLFTEAFDTGAVERRAQGQQVTAQAMAREYVQRVEVLARLGRAVEDKTSRAVGEGDLWIVYVMMLENDGKNMRHLTSPEAGAPLLRYLKLYHSDDLLLEATQPGYPPLTVSRTLVLWMIWLLSTKESILATSVEQLDELLFALRPYVFAAKQYDMSYGPWTLPSLPTTQPLTHAMEIDDDDSTGGQFVELQGGPLDPDEPNALFRANLAPSSRGRQILHYGKIIDICPPVLSHAAILNFFSRLDYSSEGRQGLDPTMVANQLGANNPQWAFPGSEPPDSGRYLSFTPANDSKQHDLDFSRLTKCYDPSTSQGLKISELLGTFEGCWEGNFSFVDFEMFRAMLQGEWNSIYEAEFGEQTQVWRLHEIVVRPKTGTDAPQTIPPGTALNAGFPSDTSSFDGFLNGPLSARFTAQSVAAAVVTTLLNGRTREECTSAMLGGLKGLEVVGKEEMRTWGEEGGECPEDVEILLVGSGHSAWGDFVLRGRVRLWDGMMTLVKEYSPDGRGRWCYRGYFVGNGVLVGRWRDCFTPQEYTGYEGTFALSRRVDVDEE